MWYDLELDEMRVGWRVEDAYNFWGCGVADMDACAVPDDVATYVFEH